MKKWILIIKMLLCLLIAVGFSGCAEGDKEIPKGIAGTPIHPDNENTQTGYVVAKRIEIPFCDNAIILDGQIITVSKESGKWIIKSLNREDGAILSEKELISESTDGRLMPSGKERAFFLLRTPEDDRNTKIYQVGYNKEVLLVGDIDISDIPKSSELPYVENMVTTDDGTTYVWYKVNILAKDSGLKRFEDAADYIHYDTNRIYVIDANGVVKGYAHEPERIVMSGTDGNAFLLFGQQDGKWFMEKVDTDGNLSDKKEAFGAGFLGDVVNGQCQFDGGELCYVREGGIWKYSTETGSNERILSLANYGIRQSEIKCFQVVQDGFLFVTCNENGSTYLEVLMGEISRETITISGVGFGNCPEIQDAVAEFNAMQDGYQVKLVDYLEGNLNYAEALSKMNLDILRGNLPDMMVVSSPLDASIYAGKGLLCDLYEFMRNDEEMPKSAFVPSLLKAYEENGKLYSLMPGFAIKSAWGLERDLGKDSGKTFQEFRDFLNGGNGKRTIYGFSADEPALVTLATALMDDFVDWESKTCNFDQKEFQDLLDFVANECKQKKYVSSGNGLASDIRDGKVTITMGNIYSVGDYVIQRKLYGDNITYAGLPSGTGSGTALFAVGAKIAISSTSGNKDIAWEFLKYYCMKGMEGRQCFPVMSKQLDEQLKSAQDSQTVTDEFGNEIRQPLAYYYDGTQQYEVYEASEKECSSLLELINSADRKFEYHPEIMKIIQEEADSFLAGDKTAKAVSEVIQNRVELYLKE